MKSYGKGLSQNKFYYHITGILLPGWTLMKYHQWYLFGFSTGNMGHIPCLRVMFTQPLDSGEHTSQAGNMSSCPLLGIPITNLLHCKVFIESFQIYIYIGTMLLIAISI